MKKSKKPAKADDKSAERKLEVLTGYVSLIESGILFPSLTDLKEVGLTRERIRQGFNTLSGLRKAAKEQFPDSFSGTLNLDDYLSDKNLEKLNKRIKKHKRFVITTAVNGQQIHQGFIDSIKYFCEENDAKLLYLPSHDPAHNLDNQIDWTFDPAVLDDDIVFEETSLNSNFFISGIRVTAKQINPITGLNELSQTKGSFISASPKQFLEFDAVSASKFPHARMTSGACTLPNYSSTRGNSQRSSYIAEFQHVIGAVIVEIVDDNIYHFRQVQADEDGSFCDLGYEYSPKKVRKLKGDEAPVLVMGDYHAGEHDETAVGAWTEMINELGIQEIVFHDFFNGASVNPHEELDIVLRSERAEKGLNSLRKELALTSDEFDRILSLKSVKKGVVVKSNHDDMLDRWLKKGAFAKDPVNFKIGVDLASALTGTKKDYLREALSMVKQPKHMDKLQWLSVDEDYVVGGIHLGAHGDKSANGARGSIKGLAKSYPHCVIGHSHTPGIFKGAFQVGTTSLLRLGYNKGPSSWVHASCLVYRNGQRQLVNAINGKWKLDDK
ncbi:MAG: hypothetical protein HC840_01095 [Leptolyngbyaceae cyanobacterium RM2_2_4]|nr:hypothetical protein [Leptolyngbyaceae cyanobacterium RM2_2_4]